MIQIPYDSPTFTVKIASASFFHQWRSLNITKTWKNLEGLSLGTPFFGGTVVPYKIVESTGLKSTTCSAHRGHQMIITRKFNHFTLCSLSRMNCYALLLAQLVFPRNKNFKDLQSNSNNNKTLQNTSKLCLAKLHWVPSCHLHLLLKSL